MKWYWNLAHLALGEEVTSLSGLQDELESHISDLYQKLLLYQIKSVCYYYRNQLISFIRDAVLWDDWDVKDVKTAEKRIEKDIAQHGSERIKAHLGAILNTAASQAEKLDNIHDAIRNHTQQTQTKDQASRDEECQRALYVTNPDVDKERIEKTKGGLLRDSYCWIFDHPEFQNFRRFSSPQNQILWIKGDPGKGKTMLLCGIIDELQKTCNDTAEGVISYFFCQATETRLSNAVSVLRGLMFLLVRKRPSLMRHMRQEYEITGEALFQDGNAWISLVRIFTNIVQDSALGDAIFIVDALDECTANCNELLGLIVELSSPQNSLSRVKWIISSRNWPEIERQLVNAQDIRLHLELNEELVSQAVEKYIEYKVEDLTTLKKYDPETRASVQKYLVANANGTFLWAALVCQQLADPKITRRHTQKILSRFPPGLDALYDRMLEQIFHSEDAVLCQDILAVSLTTQQPISLVELEVLIGLVGKLQPGDLEDIVASCGSFLTLRQGVVYLVHQSAKDFLLDKKSHQVFPAGSIAKQHRLVFQKSLEALSDTLGQDMYNLGRPGFPINQVSVPDPSPLASIRYSCIFWIDHLSQSALEETDEPSSGMNVAGFIRKYFLNWLEAMSLLQAMPQGVIAVRKLGKIAVSRILTAFAQ